MFVFLGVLASPVRNEAERGINLKNSQFQDKGVMPQSGTFIMAEPKENLLFEQLRGTQFAEAQMECVGKVVTPWTHHEQVSLSQEMFLVKNSV